MNYDTPEEIAAQIARVNKLLYEHPVFDGVKARILTGDTALNAIVEEEPRMSERQAVRGMLITYSLLEYNLRSDVYAGDNNCREIIEAAIERAREKTVDLIMLRLGRQEDDADKGAGVIPSG